MDCHRCVLKGKLNLAHNASIKTHLNRPRSRHVDFKHAILDVQIGERANLIELKSAGMLNGDQERGSLSGKTKGKGLICNTGDV